MMFCCIMCAMFNRELRPESISSTEVRNAWLMNIGAVVMMGFLYLRMGNIPAAAWAFLGFLLLAGLSTLLSNWMDKRTVLHVDGNRVSFKNGMREVNLVWGQIEKVNVFPLRWGKSVQVFGSGTQFQFRTLAEVQYQGKVRGRLGFAEGESVLEYILKETGLPLKKEEKGRYYYSRT
jgi:hypothetical protein